MPERATSPSGVPTGIELRYTKWDGRLHWHFDLQPLGEDEHGLWLGAPVGCLLQRGDEPPKESPVGFAVLIPRRGCWTAYFNNPADSDALGLPAGKLVEIYVDVTDEPKRRGAVVHAIDLDLDVLRWRDGRVSLEDEDEFLEHQVNYGYPPDVIARVEETSRELLEQMRNRSEPFGNAADRWLDHLCG